jgi:ubiquinone/menaquinone biosynthesis C-methylase UbiE
MSEIDWDSPESAARYDRNSDHQYGKCKQLIEMMGITKGNSVLDVGCGTGRQATNVAGIIGPSGRFTGIDPSSYRIELARKKFSEVSTGNIRFLVGRAEDLHAIPDNSIDHAYFCSSFHWVDNKKRALREIYRVLRPGGTVGMTTLDKDSPNMMRTIIDPILAKYHIARTEGRPRGITRVTEQELRELLTEAGFVSISIEPRTIPQKYGSPEEFMMHVEERAESAGILKNISDDIRVRIRQEITEEFRKRQLVSVGFANVTLFAVAIKPDIT